MLTLYRLQADRLILIGLSLFFFQNVILVIVDVLSVFVDPILSTIVLFIALWTDIVAAFFLARGLLKSSELNELNLDSSLVRICGYIFLSWGISVLILRVLLSMNTGIPVISDSGLITTIFILWGFSSIIYSLGVFYLIRLIRMIDEDLNVLIPNIYIIVNIIAIVLIIIGIVFGQSFFSNVGDVGNIEEVTAEQANSALVFFLGSLVKVTLIPLLGIITFYSLRMSFEENLNPNSVSKFRKKLNVTYTPKKLIPR